MTQYEKFIDISRFEESAQQGIREYLCGLCKGVVFNPRSDTCGHLFCKNCIELHLQSSKKCPINTQTLLNKNQLNEIKFIENLLKSKTVKCRFNECKWEGLYGDLEKHIKSDCLEREIECKNKNCTFKASSQKLLNHSDSCNFRVVECSDCKSEYVVSDQVLHDSICKKKLVTCKNKCGKKYYRGEEKQHFDICELMKINCAFMSVGCLEQLDKKEVFNHLNSKNLEHLKLFFSNYQTFKEDVNKRLEAIEKGQNKEFVKNFYINVGKTTINPEIKKETVLKKKRGRKSEKPEIENESNKELPSVSNENENENVEVNEKCESPVLTINDESEKSVEVSNKINSKKKRRKRGFLDQISNTENFKFVMENIHPTIRITDNRIFSENYEKTPHRFVFGKINLRNKDLSWKINVIKASNWLGFGLCQMEKAKVNNFVIYNGKEFDHGMFFFSSNGIMWNGKIKEENNAMLKNWSQIKSGDVIIMNYNQNKEILECKIGKSSWKLTSVSGNPKYTLSPCFLFLQGYDELTVEII